MCAVWSYRGWLFLFVCFFWLFGICLQCPAFCNACASCLVFYRDTENFQFWMQERDLLSQMSWKSRYVVAYLSRMLPQLYLFPWILEGLGECFPLALHFVIYYQPVSPKDERIASVNPSPAAIITGPSRDATEQPKSSDVGGELSTTHPLNLYGSNERSMSYSG